MINSFWSSVCSQYDYQVPALLEAGISVVRYDLLGYVVCQV